MKQSPQNHVPLLFAINLSVQNFNLFLVPYSEKAMATHSSTLAWKIPWMEEPGRPQFMGPLESDMTE